MEPSNGAYINGIRRTNIVEKDVSYTKQACLEHFVECEKSQERLTEIIEGKEMKEAWKKAKEKRARAAEAKVRAEGKSGRE